MKKVLVTGATGGMGAAICKLLIKNGYKVYGIDYRECQEIDGLNFYACDVTDTDAIEDVFEKISDTVSPQGVICVADMPKENDYALNKNGKYIVLNNLSNPDNIGAISRTAEAFGVDALIGFLVEYCKLNDSHNFYLLFFWVISSPFVSLL